MDLQRATYSSLPPIEAVVVHRVSNTPEQPGAMTWSGQTVVLLELLYAFLREHDDLPVDSVLDWASLRTRLQGMPDSAYAVALDSWMRKPIDHHVLINMGEGKFRYDHLARRIRVARDATADA